MLNQLRQGAQGWVSKVLMGLLVLSFAIWGIGGFQGYGAGTVATVGDTEVTAADFARAQRQAQENATQAGRQVSPEQVLQQMLLNAALDDAAADNNLGVSDQRVAKEIAAETAFHGRNGFDREVFHTVLQNAGIDRDDYVRQIRQQTVRAQMADAVGAHIEVPRPLVEAVYRFRNEARTVSTLTVDESVIEPVGALDDAALKTYFEESQERFRAPEYRKLALLTLDPANIADPAAVAGEDVAAEYERRKSSFTRPERRRIEQVRFDSREAAEEAQRTIEGGTDFLALAEGRGLKPADIDQGLKTKAEILDPAVAEAAFSAQANSVVPVLDGAIEPSLIRVTEVEQGAVTSLAEAEQRLRQDLATRAARERVHELYDGIEDARAGGATLEEIAREMSLPYRVVEAVSAEGAAPDGRAFSDLPAQRQLLAEAFESDVGVENNPIRSGDDAYVFFDVVEIEPARDRTLDEVRDQVVAAWQADETGARIAAKADELLARLRQGEPLAKIGTEIGKPVSTVEGLTRNDPKGLSANAAAQAFAGPQGHVANAEAEQPPARLLLTVDAVSVPEFSAEAPGVAEIREQLADALYSDVLRSYNAQILATRETRLNNAAYQQITGTALAR
jgi:peptidyl-prolyl cis-trans isomerase D